MKERVHQIENGGGRVHGVDGSAELRAVAHAVREVSGELFHFTYGIVVRAPDEHVVIVAHHAVAVLVGGLVVGAGGQVLLNLAEDPGIGTGAAADHDGVPIGFADHADGVLGRDDIAIADHGDPDGGLDGGDAVPIGLTGVALLAGARMQGDGVEPAILGELRHGDGDQIVVVPAGAVLH